MNDEERTVMGLVHEALYTKQDNDYLERGGIRDDHFYVWRKGQMYVVTVKTADNDEGNLEQHEKKESEEE